MPGPSGRSTGRAGNGRMQVRAVKAASYARLDLKSAQENATIVVKELHCLIHVTESYINDHWGKEIRARDRTARVTQIVTESR